MDFAWTFYLVSPEHVTGAITRVCSGSLRFTKVLLTSHRSEYQLHTAMYLT